MQQREGSGMEDLELLCLWANKIYLAALSEALPISLAEVTWPRVISYIYIHKRPNPNTGTESTVSTYRRDGET
jgi:hypothetical protein